jgi:hypothetical protein
MKRMLWLARLQILWLMLSVVEAMAAPIIAPDWQGREPNFEPGSLFWRTREFPNCPVVYRTVIRLPDKPIEFAALQLRSRRYAYLFVTRFDRFSDLDPLGESIASAEAPKENPDGEVTLFADLTTHLRKVANILPTEKRAVVLLVSAPADGFSLEGVIAFRDGSTQWLVSDPTRWRVQKLPALDCFGI